MSVEFFGVITDVGSHLFCLLSHMLFYLVGCLRFALSVLIACVISNQKTVLVLSLGYACIGAGARILIVVIFFCVGFFSRLKSWSSETLILKKYH